MSKIICPNCGHEFNPKPETLSEKEVISLLRNGKELHQSEYGNWWIGSRKKVSQELVDSLIERGLIESEFPDIPRIADRLYIWSK